VFYHPFPGMIYTDFRHKLYFSLFTIDTDRVRLILLIQGKTG
jgi:hypothetical protein